VAPELLGKQLVFVHADGTIEGLPITEVEAYGGLEDQASHARMGQTPRNSPMFESGGIAYLYLIYGNYWMLNIVTGKPGQPQAILIRGAGSISGPGRLGRHLELDSSFNRENLTTSHRLWLEGGLAPTSTIQTPRIGISYASPEWREKPWRFCSGKPV
jgi:DNA-3-methyladenine glycosylase